MPARKQIKLLLLLSLPTVLLVAVAIVLMLLHRPTRVEMVVNTSRVSFVLSEKTQSPQANDLAFERITIDGITDLGFPLTTPAIATRQSWNPKAFLTIERLPSQASKTNGIFTSFEIKPGLGIVLKGEGPKTICCELSKDKENLSLLIQPPVPFRVSSTSWERPVIVTEVAGASRFVEIRGFSGPLNSCMTLSEVDQGITIWEQIPIMAVAFEHQDGDRRVSDVKLGELKYPESTNRDKVTLEAGDFLELGDLDGEFTIRSIIMEKGSKGFSVTLGGVAGRITGGPSNFLRDKRLTCFEQLWQNQKIALLFGIVLWLFPTTVGVYKLVKELR